MFNQHTRGMATTRHRSLVRGAEERLVLETKALNTHKKEKKSQEKLILTNRKNKWIQAYEAASKATTM